jgi:hypothetical protein
VAGPDGHGPPGEVFACTAKASSRTELVAAGRVAGDGDIGETDGLAQVAMKATPVVRRHPEVAGQQPDAEHDGRYKAMAAPDRPLPAAKEVAAGSF